MRELFNPELQIQNLTVEAPKEERVSVFGLELDEALQAQLLDEVERRKTASLPAYLETLANVAFILPERKSEILVNTQKLQDIKKELRLSQRLVQLREENLRFFSNARVAMPGITDFAKIYETLSQPIKRLAERDMMDNQFENLARANLAFPGKLTEVTAALPPAIVSSCLDFLAQQYNDNASKDERYFPYLTTLTNLRLALPDRLDEIQPCPQFIKDTPLFIHGEWMSSSQIRKLCILAAKEIVIDERGARLVLPTNDSKPDTADLPEQRRY